MIETLQNITAGLLLLAGSAFILTATLGLVRLPDLYTRMHAASKAGTVGSCVMLIALVFVPGADGVAGRVAAGVLFFLLTAPVSAHLLAKAAYISGTRLSSSSVADHLKTTYARDEAK
ncbi:monovalent cation/H(+) antiporter subunit G [Oryzicola mucosus]|uniref:Monovalent cation/H(+) antiporter subunit G n=1 Tax=Oryzicola mucosus TaxID=2767425 RepID=A0A8J6PPD4_9HYPH|nr:monovalent cation/H(+) antiporter subunit G [Oryzicola mucosus]MBD0415927.1 monovalent cation/H(+) antiporter subunit G [Oryzicola mucosus]